MMNLNLIFFVGIDYIIYASLNRNKYWFFVKLPLPCCTRLPSTLTLMGQVHRGRTFEGGVQTDADRLQA